MIGLLFAIIFWWALALCAFGALMLGGMLWLWITDRLAERSRREALAHMYAMARPLRPFDREDPLERAFSLPCAPDPRRLA